MKLYNLLCDLALRGFPSKPYIEIFRIRGGSICTSINGLTDARTILSFLIEFENGFRSRDLSDYLFNRSESWTIDDLTPIDFWIIGILAYSDQRFRARLEAYLQCFQSPSAPRTGPSGEQLVRIGFDINLIVAQVMSASTPLRVHFLSMICTSGTLRMLKPFLDAGIDINEAEAYSSYLGKAAGGTNREIFQILLDSGAAVYPALKYLSHNKPRFPAEDYCYYLLSIVDRITQIDFKDHSRDPISCLLIGWDESGVTISALEHFLCTGLFNDGELFGGENISLYQRYIFLAICYNRYRALSLLLDYAIDSQRQIGDQFNSDTVFSEHGSYTWLTLAVHSAQTSCVEAIVKYADIHVRDGSGRNALELAQHYAVATHPRAPGPFFYYVISADDDNKVLAILEKAITSQQSSCLDSIVATPDVIRTPDAETELFARGMSKSKSITPSDSVFYRLTVY